MAALLVGIPIAGIIWLVSVLFPMIESWSKAEFAKQRQWEEVGRFWRPPPANAAPELLFPGQVKDYKLMAHNLKADIGEFDLHADGRRAVYKAPWGTIDLFVFHATKLEKEAFFRRVSDVLQPMKKSDHDDQNSKKIPGSTSFVGNADGTYLSYSMASGPTSNRRGVFWWSKNW